MLRCTWRCLNVRKTEITKRIMLTRFLFCKKKIVNFTNLIFFEKIEYLTSVYSAKSWLKCRVILKNNDVLERHGTQRTIPYKLFLMIKWLIINVSCLNYAKHVHVASRHKTVSWHILLNKYRTLSMMIFVNNPFF